MTSPTTVDAAEPRDDTISSLAYTLGVIEATADNALADPTQMVIALRYIRDLARGSVAPRRVVAEPTSGPIGTRHAAARVVRPQADGGE